MKKIKIPVLLFFLCVSATAFSQSKTIQIYVTPTFGNTVLRLSDSSFKTADTANLQIDVLRFYISDIQFLKNGKIVLQEQNSFHLVDAADEKTFNISVDHKQNIDYDEVKFNLGIDSATNVSGAMGGDLDPTKGMYWTWQSGYINFKLEGTSKLCNTRNHEFTFHLGGYQQSNYCLQTLSFPINNSGVIKLKLDVQKTLTQIDLVKTNHIMSASEEAVVISKIVANAFSISEN
ncbi:MAG: MbnP family protein [Bacteroidota bacterium]